MNLKNIILVASLVFCMFGVAVAEEPRIEAKFTALEFNRISSEYQPRPTFAAIVHRPGGSESVLKFEMDAYGNNTAEFGVATEFIAENIEAINKYLKWAAMAKEKGDMLDKDIGTVKGYDLGSIYSYNDYKFHSGNKDAHYLVITSNLKGLFRELIPQSSPIFLDEENANRLVVRLLEFKEGKITTPNEGDYK